MTPLTPGMFVPDSYPVIIRKFIALLSMFLAVSCGSRNADVAGITAQQHAEEIDGWHDKRVENLKGPTGWLNIAGLFWLQDGINMFGSATENQVVFPAGKIAAQAGYFLVKGDSVTMVVKEGVKITCDGKEVSSKVLFAHDSIAPHAEYGSLQWFVIRRDKELGIRLRDLDSDAVRHFDDIERYPVDLSWRVEARLEKAPDDEMINITNVLGQTTAEIFPGTLVFRLHDSEYRLAALDGGEDGLFIIFGDETNRSETYPAGRYLYAPAPGVDGLTVVDFNKAYNPPCAFTPFATCPLPPSQNVLPIAISAGERNYQDAGHQKRSP